MPATLDPDDLRRVNAALRKHNLQLQRRAEDAEQALAAIARGEVDAVTVAGTTTPVLLQAAQASLRHSELLLRSVFDGALDAMLLADDVGVYVDANPAACELFGLPRAQLLGRSIAEFAAPGYDGAAAYQAFRTHGHVRGRFPLIRPDGGRRELDYSAVAGVAPGLNLSVLRDITDRIEAEAALRRSETRFRAMIEKGSEAISLTAADGTTHYMSPAAVRLLGWSPGDAGETDQGGMFAQVAPEDRLRASAELARLVRGEVRETTVEMAVHHRDGSELWLEVSGTNLLDDPDVGAVVANFRDITVRRQFEQAMRESELRYRRLIEDLPEPVLVHVDGKIAYANLASAKIAGLTDPGQLVGQAILDFATPATRTQLEARRVAQAAGEPLQLAEQTFVRPHDGREIHVEVKTVSVVFEGRPATLSIGRDITERVASQRVATTSLREADLGRRRLEAVLAALPVGVWLADATGQLTQSNPAAARIWGGRAPSDPDRPSDGTAGPGWPEPGTTLDGVGQALARTVATGQTVVAEAIEIERFDGSRGHALNSSGPILDDQGHVVGGVVVMIDVTEAHDAMHERERLITSLEFERRRLGILLERAPAFIAVVRGPAHVVEFVNEAFVLATGGGPLVGHALADAVPELAGPGAIAMFDRVLATGEPLAADGVALTLVRRAGAAPERCYVNYVCQAIAEADGSRSGVFLHGVDVTDATVAQQRVRAQFHGVPVPTYVWQRIEREGVRQFVLVDYNQAALAISDGQIADHLGTSAERFFSDAPEVVEELERCLDQGSTIQRELDRTLRTTGKTRRLFVTYASAPPDLVIVHTADVTERSRLEQQLRQAQKMEAVGRLAGGVAHDFNNLLSVILSYVHLAIESLLPADPLRDDLVEIQTAGQRATDLTRQLLAFSRQQVLQPRVIDLSEVVAGMASMLGRLLGEDVAVTIDRGPSPGRVLADPGQIEQVVMNLAVNARDAMPDGGSLDLALATVELTAGDASALALTPGPYVVLAVRDSGAGMDAATRARIFEPFFTTKEQGRGTGLGLSMVFGIVEQSGGHVGVVSEPGHGSTFIIHLPMTDRVPEGAARSTAVRANGGSETILLVEDEDQVRAVACAILRRQGYHVLEASNGDEAVVVSAGFDARIELLLTDVVMPRMNGRKLAERLAGARPEMKVLFASGYTDDAIVHHGVLAEGVSFLQKPFTPDALSRKVRQVLDG